MSPTAPTRIVLVEDHASFRGALAAVIALEPDLTVVADVATGDAAAEVVRAHRAEVAVVDLDLPGTGGVDVVVAVRVASPGTACVVLTGLSDPLELGRAVEAGAVAVLHKSIDIPRLIDVLRRAADGANLLDPAEAAGWLQRLRDSRERGWQARLLGDSLTPREAEILGLLASGGTNQSIARELVVSPQTVQTHVRNLLAKLGASSRLEAVTTAMRLGLVQPPVDV